MGHSIYDPGQEHRPAWNVGHKLGAKRPLKPKQVWEFDFGLIERVACGTGLSSTSQSIANFEDVIW